jgi:hypothetical protein
MTEHSCDVCGKKYETRRGSLFKCVLAIGTCRVAAFDICTDCADAVSEKNKITHRVIGMLKAEVENK